MPASLTRSLVESHLATSSGRSRAPAAGAELGLRADQVLLDAEAAALALRALESAGCARVKVDPALVCAEVPPPTPAFEAGDALRYVQSAARRMGLHFSRPGNGLARHVHATRFAAPGRTVLACAPGAMAAGAFGALVLNAAEIEVAAVLAGDPHAFVMPPVWAIHLSGTMPPWVGAHELIGALAARLPAGAGAAPVLEYTGPGVASLALAVRWAVAGLGSALGAAASVFPSDGETRRWLLEQGREPDWKALAGEPESEAAHVVTVHLDTLDPMIAREDRGGGATPLREAVGTPVGRLVLGPGATLEDLRLLASVLRGRAVAPGRELVVIPGSRQIFDSVAASGALADLRAAGAQVVDSELRLAPAPPAGVVLLCGAGTGAAGRANAVGRVGAAALAAAALSGAIADPRELPFADMPVGDDRVVVDDALLVRPAPIEAGESFASGLDPLPQLPPIATTLRGVVLLRLGDRVTAETILASGPRVRRHRTHLAALAESLFAGVDRGFAARARAHGGGFVVAGGDYGIGPRDPHAVLALVELRVRGVLARSFAPALRHELVRHGILALRFAADEDHAGLRAGDELEIPGLPDVLEPNRPVALRDLTGGGQFILHHDLTAREIEMVRAGGLMGARNATGAGT